MRGVDGHTQRIKVWRIDGPCLQPGTLKLELILIRWPDGSNGMDGIDGMDEQG
jgi:hypothetical protein